MKKILMIALVFVVVLSCKKDDDQIDTKPIYSFSPILVNELIPEDNSTSDTKDRSINVIQGFASFEGGWFTSQTSASKYLIINFIGADGVSEFNTRIDINSHAQDLSLELINENELYLYTTEGKDGESTRGSGMVRLHVLLPEKVDGSRDMSKLTISIDKYYDLNYIKSTPTISEDGTQFAVRSNNTIHVHSKESIEDGLFSNVNYRFELSQEQLKDNLGNTMWFQGIALKDGLTYCLTGDSNINSYKKLFVYDDRGAVVSKSTFIATDFEFNINLKIEPEGLTFVDNVLYMCMMTRNSDDSKNLKYLCKLEKEEK